MTRVGRPQSGHGRQSALKVEPNPTLPFSDEEIARILEAAGKLRMFGR